MIVLFAKSLRFFTRERYYLISRLFPLSAIPISFMFANNRNNLRAHTGFLLRAGRPSAKASVSDKCVEFFVRETYVLTTYLFGLSTSD
ncbi:hypothetical protein HOV93_25100 [Planctomycetes bacterium FF15]|uniref:Uncharacterized protein n=1 Tax=Bremerella alba TaxID=980252 RepID=A0A7V8V5R5_9BACT|nr:hypothetical protein [Bremerella alba]